jgi:hypothetical protein
LGIASLIFGSLGGILCAISMRDTWQEVFDPTFTWAYPPPRWVPLAHLGAVAAVIAGYVGLAAAGVWSLVRPAAVLRGHLAALSLVGPAILAAFVTLILEFRPHPDFGKLDLWIGWLIECTVTSAYPTIALCVVVRKLIASRGSPVAV